MGDIAVDIFQETLKELITSTKLSLITEEKHQLQSLEEEIKYLRRFLKATEKKRNDHSEVMKLVMQIRDLISDAENILELFVVHAFKANHASYSLESVKERMKILTAEVKIIYDKNMYDINGAVVKQVKPSSTGSGGSAGSSRVSHTSKVVKEKVVMGFEEEIEKLIAKLDEGEDEPLEIISIIGPGGGGKTTLARQVYDHTFTSRTFEIRAWVDVSQGYDITRKRDLLIRILESIIPGNYEKSSDDKLAEDILKCLKGRKYLIVMDDIWGSEAWNAIERSFPKECEGSKVLFTSRLLVQLEGIRYFPHYLAPLPKNVCWELLQKQVFGMKCCPPELVDVGELIAEKCKGLPLAVITIAGILATEDMTLNVWEKVAKHLSSIIAQNQEGCMEILELSYNHMPLHLKACFLYIGGYPEDYEIPVRELIWLWIAEGFIQQNDGGESLETIAKDYLIGLIDRSLVQVATKGPLGGIKVCRIHDLLHELCLKKAKDDHFFVKNFENDYVPNPNTKQRRRLLIGNHFFENFSLKPENLRSFLCLGSSAGRFESTPVTNLSFFVENFKLLRVLSFVPLKCEGKIGTGQLVHLRYLAYQVGDDSWTIPFSKFLNLETLYLDISLPRNVTVAHPYLENGEMIQLPCDIFKMVKLRHLHTKRGQFTFHHSSEETGGSDFDCSSKLDSLQTLHRICACEACRSFLVRTPNLRKLGLYGGKITEDNNVLRLLELERLKCLEKLTFSAHYKFDPTVESTFLPGLKLPLTITRITFKYTRIKWEELSLLQTLPSLEVLRLLCQACAGPVWNTSELEGFPQLKYLKLKELDIEEWNAFEDQFPKLEVLVVEVCLKLERIPIDFGNLNELREIKLEFCRRSAEESAREIQEGQSNRNGDDDCLNLLARWNHENSDSNQWGEIEIIT